MKFFDCFTGIGGFTVGIQRAIPGSECIGFSEFDPSCDKTTTEGRCSGYHYSIGNFQSKCNLCGKVKTQHAAKVYSHHFPNHKEYGDITKIATGPLPAFDCLVGGFPCQSFSIAGKRGGFEDTRGTLFFELARILRDKRPRCFVFENVKGLLSHDEGRTFKTIITALDELGYFVEWQVLNSKNFGVPQNRERVFIIGHLGGEPARKVFPFRESYKKTSEPSGQFIKVKANTKTGFEIAREGDSVNFSQPTSKTRRGRVGKQCAQTLDTGVQQGVVVSQSFVALTEKRTDEAKKIRRDTKGKDFSPRRGKQLEPRTDGMGNCVTATHGKEHLLGDGTRIRRLTPLECERLQGFPDNWTNVNNMSDAQRYKQCGNAVTVNVIEAIFTKLK